MRDSSRKIVQVIRSIPPGKVLSYGEIARRAGLQNGARTVSRMLHSSSEKHDLPWHRVINSRGTISLKGQGYRLQKALLLSEGIEFDAHDRIDLDHYSQTVHAISE